MTAAAGYTSNAAHVAEVDRAGRVRTGTFAGEAAITVHYMGQVAAVRFQVPRPGRPEPYPALPVNNTIDELVWAKLKTMGILPSELADDATFLRRRLPRRPRHAARRRTRSAPSSRTPTPTSGRRLIDKVLDRPEYADYWAQKWADVLLVNRDKLGDRGATRCTAGCGRSSPRTAPTTSGCAS